MNTITEKMLQANTDDFGDESQRLREAMQQIALAGLYRGGFFSKAAFYGGTCLRMFHGLPRLSEDMDFSLLECDPLFQVEAYFPQVIEEFRSLGIEVDIRRKKKNATTAIESAFLKSDTALYHVGLVSNAAVRIKLEVDTQPPGGFLTENRVSILPFSFMTRCYELPYLYAGKMHALLFRRWKTRVKGRDWFDFEWYVKNGIELSFDHFQERMRQSDPEGTAIHSFDDLREALTKRIATVDFKAAKKDVAPFIKDTSGLDIWSAEYFNALVALIRFLPSESQNG